MFSAICCRKWVEQNYACPNMGTTWRHRSVNWHASMQASLLPCIDRSSSTPTRGCAGRGYRYLTIPVGYQDTLRTSSLTSKPSSPSRVCQDVNVYWPWRAHGLNMGLKPPAIAGYHVTAADCEDE